MTNLGNKAMCSNTRTFENANKQKINYCVLKHLQLTLCITTNKHHSTQDSPEVCGASSQFPGNTVYPLSPRDGFPLILTYKPWAKVYQGSLPCADDLVSGMAADQRA